MLERLVGVKTFDKGVPEILFMMHECVIKEFLLWAHKGDAWLPERCESKVYSKRNESLAFHFGTASRKAAFGMYVLYSILGYEISVHTRELESGNLFYTLKKCVGPQRAKTGKVKITEEKFDGYAYDLEVPGTQRFASGVGQIVLHNTDFGVKVNSAGFKVQYIPEARIMHHMHMDQNRAHHQNALRLGFVWFLSKWSKFLKVYDGYDPMKTRDLPVRNDGFMHLSDEKVKKIEGYGEDLRSEKYL